MSGRANSAGGSAPGRRNIFIAAIIVCAVAAVGWFAFGGGFGQAQSNRLTITTSTGTHDFTIEWARTVQQRSQGLMGRTEMAEDHGMLFDFINEFPVSFWMKNTPLPLDMIFIHADGTVYRIEPSTTPFSEKMIPSGAKVRYVLEINGGVSAKIGLTPGDKIRIPPPPAAN